MSLRLADAVVAAGYRLRVFETIGSTNDAAMAAAGEGDPGCLWLVAHEQSAGRGRHGRAWASPPGNLYATLLLINPAPMAVAPQLGFVAGAALARAVACLVPPKSFSIKWPNDLVSGAAKLSGLLLEVRLLADGRTAVAIGFGVNCLVQPAGLNRTASALSTLCGKPVAPADVLHVLSSAMPEMLALWAAGAHFSRVRAIWLDFAAGLGDVLRVETSARKVTGVFETIDAHGRLVLQTQNGRIEIDAGDVFLPTQPRRERATRT